MSRTARMAALVPTRGAAPARTTWVRRGLVWAALAVLASCLLAPGPARANITRPKSIHSPSAALEAPAQGLAALGEELQLTCDAKGCDVRAVYRVRATAQGRWRMAMVLPQPGRVTVRAGGTKLEAVSRPMAWPDPQPAYEGPGDMPREHRLPVMHQAVFELALPAGDGVLEVVYRQEWGREERKFGGYFSGWLAARTLRYELWPLAEWSLAPGFTLGLSITIHDEDAGAALLRGADGPHAAPANLGLLKPGVNGVFTLKRQWGRAFPARLELVVGGREEVATFGVEPPPPPRPDRGEW